MSDRLWLNRKKERGSLESLRKKEAEQMKLDMGRLSERKEAEEGGRGSDREKAKCVWESFEAEVHCRRPDRVSGGSEVWINASDWRRAAAVVREQNIRWREKREAKGNGTDDILGLMILRHKLHLLHFANYQGTLTKLLNNLLMQPLFAWCLVYKELYKLKVRQLILKAGGQHFFD